jgi:hypothetical protein
MTESQVVVIPRPPKGRKRSGGGYIGRSRKPATTTSRRLCPVDRELAEFLAGSGWVTRPEIAAALGIRLELLSPRLSRLRRFGSPEYALLRQDGRQGAGPGRGQVGAAGRPGTLIHYRVEKGKAQSASE